MLTGSESVLKSALEAAIQAGILSEHSVSPQLPNNIAGLAKGIADAIIPHLINNTQVDTGAVVTTPDTVNGTVTGVGTIS